MTSSSAIAEILLNAETARVLACCRQVQCVSIHCGAVCRYARLADNQ